jgi:hypothetical protein
MKDRANLKDTFQIRKGSLHLLFVIGHKVHGPVEMLNRKLREPVNVPEPPDPGKTRFRGQHSHCTNVRRDS